MSYLRIFEAFIEFGETHVLCKFLEQYFDKDATAKIDKRKKCKVLRWSHTQFKNKNVGNRGTRDSTRDRWVFVQSPVL